MPPLLVGITGGIGSGKSSVGRMLAQYCGAPLIDVDQCCRYLLEIDQPGWRALRAVLDSSFFQPDGSLHRAYLRAHIFSNAALRAQVDSLLHPLAREMLHQALKPYEDPLIFVEIPLLYEAGWDAEVNVVLVIYARPAVRCCRIMRRDTVNRREACRAIAAQMKLEEKAGRANFVIDNSGSWASAQQQVIVLGDRLLESLSKPNLARKCLTAGPETNN